VNKTSEITKSKSVIMKTNTYFRIVISILFFSSLIFPQKHEIFSITGKIVDLVSKEPISYVNVFLDATTLGASTNNNGVYSIKNIPKGSYEIIISAIGYERINEYIILKDSLAINRDYDLKPTVYKLQEVSVVAEKDDNWASNFSLFKQEFLGTSEFANDCKILNPEVINFINDKNAKLKVVANAPVEINNYALGYKVYFEIKDFVLFKNREFNYLGNIRFVELEPMSGEQNQKWIKNRRNNFNGSFKHFLIALSKNKLEENSFLIYSVFEPNWDNLRRRNFLSPKVSEIIKNISSIENEMEFSNSLMVVYDDWEENNFQKFRNSMGSNIYKTLSFQTSWITLPYSTATFDINGNLVNDYSSIKIFGYWAWLRVANLLPNNYVNSE